MKTIVVVFVAVLMISSCMPELCPTYSGTRRNGDSMSAFRKQREVKDKTPYYKLVKRAETD